MPDLPKQEYAAAFETQYISYVKLKRMLVLVYGRPKGRREEEKARKKFRQCRIRFFFFTKKAVPKIFWKVEWKEKLWCKMLSQEAIAYIIHGKLNKRKNIHKQKGKHV